ncbi:MAG: hypothetical protein O7G30_06130, partial [Proteobacteria bacterium]|nr:hypothetical protein [Pseudomonadota bacterium]
MSRSAALAVLALVAGIAAPALAAWNPPGVDLTRPRILFRPGDVPAIQAKLDRNPLPEPYVTLLDDMAERTALAEGVALDDDGITAQRFKARAAKNLAFLYAVERTWDGEEVAPFASPEDRRAVGDRVRDLLVNLYNRSRLAVPPPLGGDDRDISSSEELLQFATAYDALLGAGYDFGGDEALIVENLADLASELYENYVRPGTAGNYSLLHQNNHRSKTGAALAVAAVVLAEYTPAAGSDPNDVREPTRWLEFGLDMVDLIMRFVLVAGDGVYGEGPHYQKFAWLNHMTFGRAWDRLVDGADWPARGGVLVPSLWRHPLTARGQRWMLDMTLPDGSLAPVDDSFVGRSHYFGTVPPGTADAAAFYWRWANAPRPYETDGNIDLAADAIILYDDSVVPAPPGGSPSAFWFEGGHAVLRSDWSEDGTVAVIQAEHDQAASFGRTREGLGVGPQSHEHPEPGSFLLNAFGERLAMDPGFLSFDDRLRVSLPRHHNVILVDGEGPVDYLFASLAWPITPEDRPLADGMATLTDAIDTDFLDAVRVVTRYGLGFFVPFETAPRIDRRFLFPAHRSLLIADRVDGRADPAHTFSWMLHGNGGGTSGGTFEATPAGGRWVVGGARLDGAFSFDAGPPVFTTSEEEHEIPPRQARTHTALAASVTAAAVRSLEWVYPSRASDDPPALSEVALEGAAALRVEDESGDRRAVAVHRDGAGTPLVLNGIPGLARAESDGSLFLIDAHWDGTLRTAWAEGARRLAYGDDVYFDAAGPGIFGIHLSAGQADVVADDGSPTVAVGGLSFVPVAADGACALDTGGSLPVVTLNRERRFSLRQAPGNARPAADAGADRRVARAPGPDNWVSLD